jgi:TPR repeat protein
MASEQGNCAKLARKSKGRVLIASHSLLLFLLLTSLPTSVRADALAEGVRAYAAEKYNRSLRILMVRAEQEDAQAQTYIGVMYLRGRGVPPELRGGG